MKELIKIIYYFCVVHLKKGCSMQKSCSIPKDTDSINTNNPGTKAKGKLRRSNQRSSARRRYAMHRR